MTTVSQWFRKERPHHVGVYQVKESNGWIAYAYWDGRKFGFRHDAGSERAFEWRKIHTCLKAFVPWRGVAK